LAEHAPRLLFLPVSGEFGMGEYARSLAIAQGALARWPDAVIHFVLSRRARYAATAPFPVTLLDSSPTFHTAEVSALIRSWRPDLVVFDNAGRSAQLRAAKHAGAHVIYISARARQRRKAFRLGWMRIIDEHWIAYPRFIAGELGLLERLKLRFLQRPRVRFLDVILAGVAGGEAAAPSDRGEHGAHGAQGAQGALAGYVLIVPGGGTAHAGARDAVERFRLAAQRLAERGIATRFVGPDKPRGATDAEIASPAMLRMLGLLPQSELARQMRGARLIVANGGSTLLQAIACGIPCIAVPIAGDQAARISHCVRAGVALAAALDATAIERAVSLLLADEGAQRAMAARARDLGLADGVQVAVRAMTALLTTAPG